LETYLYGMKSTITDKMKDKIPEDDATTCLESVTNGLEWLDDNSESADSADFEEKRKDVADICDPIVAKVYQSGDMGEDEGAFGEDSHDEL
jgi:hypothetical protein